MHLHFRSKRDECPGKRTAKNDKPNEKQILSGHAGFWLKQVSVVLIRRMHAGLVVERQEIAISCQKNPTNGNEPTAKGERRAGCFWRADHRAVAVFGASEQFIGSR